MTGVGFVNFVSLGNKADLNEIDFMQAWQEDKETQVILAYLEGITDGQRFMQVAREVSKRKPVVVVKSGRTSAGARAVSSHTGSLAGSDAAYDAAFAQSGVLRASTMDEFFDLAGGFSAQPIPRGERIAIVTNAGGPGILATDACEKYGLKLAGFASATIERLKTTLPPAANVYNPVDVLGDASAGLYQFALETVLADPGVDGVIVLATPQAMTDVVGIADVVRKIKKNTDKPVLPGFMGGVEVEKGVRQLEQDRLLNYNDPERAAYTMRMLARYNRVRSRVYESPRQFDGGPGGSPEGHRRRPPGRHQRARPRGAAGAGGLRHPDAEVPHRQRRGPGRGRRPGDRLPGGHEDRVPADRPQVRRGRRAGRAGGR